MRSRYSGSGAVATGALFTLAAPPIGWWPLAGVCLVPLLWSLRGRGAWARACLGGLAGTVAALGTVVWPLGGALAAYFSLATWQGLLAALGVGALFGGVGFALFAFLAGDGTSRPVMNAVRVGAAWVAADLFRTHAFTGLPWLLLGHLLAPVPALAQLAALGGTALVSFWLASTNALWLALAPGPRRAPAVRLAGVLAAAAVLAWLVAPVSEPGRPGAIEVLEPDDAPLASREALRVALVQPSLPRDWRHDVTRAHASLERLVGLSRRVPVVDLVVWPENALPVPQPANAGLIRTALEALGEGGPQLLLGAARYDPLAPGHVYSSAMLWDGRGESERWHDKVHLVPFTEYVPAALAPFLSERAGAGEGDSPVALPVGSTVVGPLICYELLFADLARALVSDGAELLVNLSYDGWFGGLGAAEQHLAAAVLRAIELRRPLLRSTSDGITVAIDGRGEVVARLAPRTPGTLALSVWPSAARSPYSRVGDLPAWLAAVLVVLVTLGELLLRRGGAR